MVWTMLKQFLKRKRGKTRIWETLNFLMCADSITDANENGLKLVKTGKNSSKRFKTAQNFLKHVKMSENR